MHTRLDRDLPRHTRPTDAIASQVSRFGWASGDASVLVFPGLVSVALTVVVNVRLSSSAARPYLNISDYM